MGWFKMEEHYVRVTDRNGTFDKKTDSSYRRCLDNCFECKLTRINGCCIFHGELDIDEDYKRNIQEGLV